MRRLWLLLVLLILASCSNQQLDSAGSVPPGAHVSVTPSAPRLDVGSTQQLTAVVLTHDDKATKDQSITWSSSDETVAGISAEGLLTAVGEGNAVITATSVDPEVFTSVEVTVTDPVVGLRINEAEVTLVLGEDDHHQFVAELTHASGSTSIPEEVTWSISDASVANIDANGKLTVIGSGSATVLAQSGDLTANSLVTVTPPETTIVTVDDPDEWFAVEPAAATLVLGVDETITLAAQYNHSSGDHSSVSTVVWYSSDEGVATVAQDGQVTAHQPGWARITALNHSTMESATSWITVEDSYQSARFAEPDIHLELTSNETHQIAIVYEMASGTQVPAPMSDLTWNHPGTPSDKVTIDELGLITPQNPGAARISVSTPYGTATANVTVWVYSETLRITPDPVTISPLTVPNGSQGRQLEATLVHADYPDQVVTGLASWSSSHPAVVTVNGGYVRHGHDLYQDHSIITATYEDPHGNLITATSTVFITKIITNMYFENPNPELNLNHPQTHELQMLVRSKQFFGSDWLVDPATGTWHTANPAVATVSSSGLVTAVAPGQTTLVATFDTGNQTYTLKAEITVNDPVLSIEVTPDDVEILLGKDDPDAPLTATAHYGSGDSADITASADWATTNANVATVSAAGLISAKGPGNTTITASYEGVSAVIDVLVGEYDPIEGIDITPAIATLNYADADPLLTLSATFRYFDGPAQDATQAVAWSVTENPELITINSDHTVGLTGAGAGTATITATYGYHTQDLAVTIVDPVVSLEFQQTDIRLEHGNPYRDSLLVTPTFAHASGLQSDPTSAGAWTASNESVLAVNDDGLITSVATGTSDLTAVVDGFTHTTTVTVVDHDPITELTVTPTNIVLAPLQGVQLHLQSHHESGAIRDVPALEATWSVFASGPFDDVFVSELGYVQAGGQRRGGSVIVEYQGVTKWVSIRATGCRIFCG